MEYKANRQLVVFWLILVVILTAGTTLAGPAIQILNPTFDFGKTLQHVKVTHDFWIKSVGDETLVITRISPGCGCTQAPLRDSVLAPGDSTVLSIIFSTKSFARSITKRPYLLTNVSDARAELTITADVVVEPEKMAPLKITPFEIDVSQSGQKERRQAVFLIENVSDQDLKLSLVDEANDLFETTLPGAVKAGETVEGMVVVRKTATQLEFEKSVTLEVNDANRTRYTLPVNRALSSSAEVEK